MLKYVYRTISVALLGVVFLGGMAFAQVVPQPPKGLIDSLRANPSPETNRPAVEQEKPKVEEQQRQLAVDDKAPRSSSVEPGNEITTPLPGEDGGRADPAQSLGRNQIMFIVRNAHPRVVDIAFYSAQRRVAWPGNGRVYTMRDSKAHHYVLNCSPGEKICYGAAVRNRYRTYWGAGIGNKHRCPSCCYVCNGKQTSPIVLGQ